MSQRRESVGRLTARTQSASEAPVQEMVSVAVLPPRLPAGMAPPTGIGGAMAMSWDERLNWQHNEDPKDENVSRRKSFLRKAGITTQRQKVNPDTPPFTLRQVPYDTWRKHYAKDKMGNYKGTHAPAEDCLLKPDDVAKWRLGEATSARDRWTRGSEALPVYNEVHTTEAVPEYEHDYDGPPRTPHPDLPAGEDYLDPDDDVLVSHHERAQKRTGSTTSRPDSMRQPSYSVSRTDSIPEEPEARGKTIANGKTAKEIIAEAEARGKIKPTWKQMLSKGVQQASFGG